MVESNKILTVSYGTFSCTLEGFDDAFDTMKAIAEYFRDLAADDRYFGAEPPTPDAEMLARLAERNMSRRVTARSEEGNIVLSPDTRDDAPASRPQVDPAPVATPRPEAEAEELVVAPAPRPEAEDASEDAPAIPQRAPRISAALAAAGGAALLASAPTVTESAPEAHEAPELQAPEVAPEVPAAQAAPDATPVFAEEDAPLEDLAEVDPLDLLLTETLAENSADALELPPVAEEAQPEDPLAAPAEKEPSEADPLTALLGEPTEDEPPETLDSLLGDAPETQDIDLPEVTFVEEAGEVAALVEPEILVLAEPELAPAPQTGMAESAEAPQPDVSVDAEGQPVEEAALAAEAEALDTPVTADPAVEGMEEDQTIDLTPSGEGWDSIAEAEQAISAARAVDATWVTVAPARPDVIDVALKLQRIRDVVTRRRALAEGLAAADATPTAALSVQVQSDAGQSDGGDALAADTVVSAEPALAPLILDDLAPVPPIAEEEATFSSTIGATDGAEDAGHAAEGGLLDADAGEDSLFAEEADDLEPAPRVMARVVKVKRREDLEALAGAAEDSSLSPEEEDELQRELAALEQEIARGNLAIGLDPEDMTPESEAPEVDAAASEPVADEPDLSDAAPLPPALAEEEAERNALADIEVPERRPVRSLRESARDTLRAADHSAQMDRILRETDHHFEQEDSTRRRSALAHLRAAVAAKKAEKAAGSDFAPREDTTDAYREDLAQVVRPRRPAIAHQSETPTRRSESRPAPLKLVAEQRIDTEAAPRGPIRPRRISVADLARQDDSAQSPHRRTPITATPAPTLEPDESFDDYASSVGAKSLGELLEAAASYISFMEGQPLFSRPQLMARVKALAPSDFSREDGLRAFGQLLRDGKIRKAEAGRFAVSDSIGFRPEERAAG